MKQFVTTYWSKGLNFLHSITYMMSSVYNLMILWLPYFFIRIGFQQALISLVYPFAFFVSGLIFQPLQMVFKGHIGSFFLGVLILNIILTFFLNRLGDDSEEIPLYIILIFGCSILSSGFIIFSRTTDLRNRTESTRQFLLANSLNGISVQIICMIEMAVSGVIMK